MARIGHTCWEWVGHLNPGRRIRSAVRQPQSVGDRIAHVRLVLTRRLGNPQVRSEVDELALLRTDSDIAGDILAPDLPVQCLATEGEPVRCDIEAPNALRLAHCFPSIIRSAGHVVVDLRDIRADAADGIVHLHRHVGRSRRGRCEVGRCQTPVHKDRTSQVQFDPRNRTWRFYIPGSVGAPEGD